MGINNHIMWVLIDPVMTDSYNRNATLVGSVLLLKRVTHRLMFELKREIGWGLRLIWNAELAEVRVWVWMQSWLWSVFAVGTWSWLRSAFAVGTRSWPRFVFAVWNAELVMVHVCSWKRGPHFVLKRDLRLGMRSVSKVLSSVIFRQPTPWYTYYIWLSLSQQG